MKKLISRLFVILSALIALAACGGASRPATDLDLSDHANALPTELTEKIDAVVTQKMDEYHLAGLTVAISDGEHPVFVKRYGYADLEASEPTQPDTAYRIASISKSFTAAAILELAEGNQLTLDDPVNTFFPDLVGADGITVRHLLNHTGGDARQPIVA